MHTADVMRSREHGSPYGTGLYGSDINDEDFSSRVETNKLAVRIQDEQLRESVEMLTEMAVKISFAQSEGEAEEIMMAVIEAFNIVNRRLGELLRSVY
jgi:hypothetical protein